jgi:tetratricopeptide (TPR) repeat protein
MKILFFILGSIKKRILDWGLDNMKELLEQDIVFYGPISEKEFYYYEKRISLINLTKETKITDIFKRLPSDWYPDIVTCDVSVLNYIPDIYNCPVKTYLQGRDGWGDILYNRKISELFDFFSYSVIDRDEYKQLKTNLSSLLGMPVSIPSNKLKEKKFEKRKIDILSIANYDNSFYHDRYKILYKLSELNDDNYVIRYIVGIKRAEIHNYYRNTKIVIDWSHTLSNRSYEAALNGCLLFSHENNPLMKEFWVEWKEYIPYNEENLLDLIRHYIGNPQKSEEIIKRMKEKFDITPSSFGKTILFHLNEAILEKIDINQRISRCNNLDKTDLYHRTTTCFYHNFNYSNFNFPINWVDIYFRRINKSIFLGGSDKKIISPLIEASRMSFLLKRYKDTLIYLEQLEQILPEYAWTYYLRGSIYFNQGNYGKALSFTQQAITLGLKTPSLLMEHVLPFVEKVNICDARRVTDYMWKTVYNHNNEYQVKALLYLSFELSGDIYLKMGLQKDSINSYLEATDILPISRCFYKLNSILMNMNQYEIIRNNMEKALNDSPYDSILYLYKFLVLNKSKEYDSAVNLIKRHLKSIKPFRGNRKILFFKIAFNILILVSFINKRLNQKILRKLLKYA